MKTTLHLAFAFFAGCLAALPAAGQSGDLDPSFGSGGRVLTAIGNGDDRGHGVALQSDGKLVVAGYSHNGSNNDFAVVRYNTDGTLDTTFDGTGKVVTDFGGTDDIANGVAVQSDGKIIVVGRALVGGTSSGFALARYHPNGTLDTSFGPAGTGMILTVIGFAHAETQATNVRLQPDGKILVVGNAAPDGNADFVVLRYHGDGTLDNGFGTGGMVSTSNVTGFGGAHAHNDYALDLALREDGKILVGGHSTGPLNGGYMLTVYHNDGTPDTGFATGGKMYLYSEPAGMNQVHCVAWQADDKILVGGISGTGAGRNFCLRRFSDVGVADATFGNNGLVVTPIGTAADVPYDLAVQGDGKIVMIGSSYNADTGFDDFALVRHHSDGSLDTTFRGTSRVTTNFPDGYAVGRSVVIGPDGRIVIAGYAHDGTKHHFALARYFAEGSLVMIVPSHLSHTNQSQPLIAGKASPGFTVNVHIDGSVVGSTVADGSGAWSLTVSQPLLDGVHAVAVTETDGFGSTGPLSAPVSFTVDTVAPVAPVITSPAEAALVHCSHPVVTGSAEPRAMVTIYFDDTVAGSAYASSLGLWSFTPPTALVNGMHTVKATSTDRAGNTGAFSGTIGFSTLAALFGGPGNPDTSFGVAGKLLTPVGLGDDRGHGVALQSDGKLVVAGYTHNGSNNDFAVLRYNADGTLDTTFGGTGKVVTDFGGTDDIANGVAVQSDGKIIVVGSASSASSWLFALARYHPDGVLDTSFGLAGTGRVTTTIGYPISGTRAEGVTIQHDGKILVVGNAAPDGNPDFVMLRYLGDGTLDNGFGTGGMVSTGNATPHGHNDFALDLALREDGKILAGGQSTGPLNSGYMVTVHNSDGTPDTAFATDGKMYVSFFSEPAGMNQVHCVAWQADDKILVGGISGSGAGRNFCLRRFSETGVVDSTFGDNGVVVTPIGTAADVSYDLAMQGDGKIVAIGSSYNANTGFDDFAVVRYHADGSLDTTFRGTGRVTANFPDGNAVGRSVVIGPDGRIVIAGYAHDGTKDHFALARFFGTDQPPQVTTGGATGIVRDGAVLNGTANPNNLATVAHFEYGLTIDYDNTTPEMVIGNGYLDVPASRVIGGLTDNTLYHYRLVSTNAAGTTYGEDAVFTTAPNPPLAFTGEAANVSASGATLVGTVLPNGRDTTVYFEFGLSAAYGAQTSSQLVPASGTIEDVFASLTGLVPGATYHFRLVAVNAGSPIPITGADRTFVALAPAPVVDLGAAVPLSSTSVGLSGSVNANDASTQVFFDYGTDGSSFPFSVAATPAMVIGTNSTAVTGSFTNLSQGVTYHYRLRAVSAGGTTTSGVASFTLDLLSGLIQVFPGAVPDAEGSLIVNLTPAGILHGWRFIGERQWRASGVAVGGLTTGDREIEFRPVAGYIHPPAESTVNVTSGGATTIITRDYYETNVTGSGGLSVTLKPDSITSGEDRAQWRLLGEDDAQWRDSGATLTGLIPGSYLIECKPVAGRSTPPNANVVISDGQTAAPTLTYFLAATATGALPNVLAFETVATDQSKPYAYVGQIRSNVGMGTGFAVKERVVATAAHVVWDEGTLSAAQGLQWHFQRHRGNHEPIPQAPRGFYLLAGYAAQRQTEDSPGSFSPQSRNLDVAALYFLSAAARGGHGGFLASDLDANEFLLSNANKMLVGYPVDGIPTGSQGRMHATTPGNVHFGAVGAAANRTFLTSGIRSTGGASGGPLCVQFDGGSYYPAAVYLGGTEQTLVRAIDSTVIDLFNRAELSGIDDLPHTGGGITHSSFSATTSTGVSGALKVTIEPLAARNAGAGWRLKPDTNYIQSGFQKNNLREGSYILELRTVDGFAAPTPQSVVINGGQLHEITYTYNSGNTALETWRFANFGSTHAAGDAADDADPDGDGATNLEEFHAGTDPKNPLDVFRVIRIAATGNSFSVVFPGKPGRGYTLQRAPTLSGPWQNVATSGILVDQREQTLNDPSRLPDRGFYRVATSANP